MSARMLSCSNMPAAIEHAYRHKAQLHRMSGNIGKAASQSSHHPAQQVLAALRPVTDLMSPLSWLRTPRASSWIAELQDRYTAAPTVSHCISEASRQEARPPGRLTQVPVVEPGSKSLAIIFTTTARQPPIVSHTAAQSRPATCRESSDWIVSVA
jgi:hypothetical protein